MSLLHLWFAAVVCAVVRWAPRWGLEVLELAEAICRYLKRRRKRRKKQHKGAAP